MVQPACVMCRAECVAYGMVCGVAYGAWCIVYGVWRMTYGVSCMVCGVKWWLWWWCAVCSVWCMVAV